MGEPIGSIGSSCLLYHSGQLTVAWDPVVSCDSYDIRGQVAPWDCISTVPLMIEPSGPSILDFVGDPVISLDPLADSPIAHIRPGSNIELTSHLI